MGIGIRRDEQRVESKCHPSSWSHTAMDSAPTKK